MDELKRHLHRKQFCERVNRLEYIERLLKARELWTVYDSPKDYHGQFIARKFVIVGGGQNVTAKATDQFLTSDTLAGLRSSLPEGLKRMDRMPDDDPVIVEVWL